MTHEKELDLKIQFPTEFTVKVLGKNTPEFETTALSLTRKIFPTLTENAITQRTSKDKNYLSLSITVFAENQAQLDALYQSLTDAPEIIAAL